MSLHERCRRRADHFGPRKSLESGLASAMGKIRVQ
jgi:hypothetical protein